jgi:hypothetical protein
MFKTIDSSLILALEVTYWVFFLVWLPAWLEEFKAKRDLSGELGLVLASLIIPEFLIWALMVWC